MTKYVIFCEIWEKMSVPNIKNLGLLGCNTRITPELVLPEGVILVLPRCYSGATQVLLWCYSGVTLVLLWCYSGVTLVLLWCYSGVTLVLLWCYSGVTLVLLWCYSGVTQVLLRCYRVTQVLLWCQIWAEVEFSLHLSYTWVTQHKLNSPNSKLEMTHCDEVCICWHFGAPGTPGFYVRAQHDPRKKKLNYFFILKFKRFLSYCLFDM